MSFHSSRKIYVSLLIADCLCLEETDAGIPKEAILSMTQLLCLTVTHLQDPSISHSLTAEQRGMAALSVSLPSADVSNPTALTRHLPY